MIDLTGSVLTHTIEQTSRYLEATNAVSIDDAIYIVRVIGDEWRSLGGVIPTPGDAEIGDGYTRQVIMPAGGMFEDNLGRLLSPATDDCSKPRTMCAGLPASLWPPLESEILGNQTERPYESSFSHYLEMAKLASAEADRLGLELLESGLELDTCCRSPKSA